jgi:predicted secreted protein
MADNFTLGMNCKLFLGADLLSLEVGASSATWTEADNVKDLTLNLSAGEADITTRANGGWKATAATLKEGSIEFDMLWKPSDDLFDAIQEAWLGGDEIAAAAMSGPVTGEGSSGSQGLASNFSVTNFTRNEPLNEAVTVKVTLKPSSFTEWYTV